MKRRVFELRLSPRITLEIRCSQVPLVSQSLREFVVINVDHNWPTGTAPRSRFLPFSTGALSSSFCHHAKLSGRSAPSAVVSLVRVDPKKTTVASHWMPTESSLSPCSYNCARPTIRTGGSSCFKNNKQQTVLSLFIISHWPLCLHYVPVSRSAHIYEEPLTDL